MVTNSKKSNKQSKQTVQSLLLAKLCTIAKNYRALSGLDEQFLKETIEQTLNECLRMRKIKPDNGCITCPNCNLILKLDDIKRENILELLNTIANDIFEIRKIMTERPNLLLQGMR